MSHRILLIQEDQTEAGSIRDALANSTDSFFQVEWVRRCIDGLERLRAESKRRAPDTGRIDAVLVDLFLADSRGIETFDKIFELVPQLPILVLIAAKEESIAKVAVQRGAQDYLLKNRIDAYLLPKALRNMIERAANAEALFEEKERAQVTLNSIGDAVMSTDTHGHVTYLNVVAERLTGWSREQAAGRLLEEVFVIIDGVSRERVQNPMVAAIRDNRTEGLTPNCILIRRDGFEAAIEDSAAPIHDRHGQVTGAVIVFHDVSGARALSLRMAHLAQHDSLTDLPNRMLLNDRLTQGLALAKRGRVQLALLYLDMDRFKNVNDSLGHAVGDRLLQSVANRLLGCVRGSDTVSRQGGDEFVILLSQVGNAQDAAVCAEKILGVLAAPHYIAETELHVTVSIGIVTYPNDGADAESLLQNADFAMYQAKNYGRNCYQFFASEMNVAALERQSVENALRQALERREFVLHYQPKRNLKSGTITAVEALVRWNHPRRGLVPPGQFIPIAEESGLIVAIGRWILQEGCRQAKEWREAGFAPIRIAINVSAVELRAKEFVTGVREVLTETGLEPRYLELELTETFLMQDTRSTAEVLRALKGVGVRIALDDFGTGYSSLSYMKRFPVDTLKIDKSFVQCVTSDPVDAGIVSAVITMGKSLHMRVVAEGIETTEQLAFLQRHSCPEGQGYYLGYPVPALEMARLLKAESPREVGRGPPADTA